jgi:hypothetical protein
MEVQITCVHCSSSIEVLPDHAATKVCCDICGHIQEVTFSNDHESGILKECPVCHRMDFYKQADFNRKIGVVLFVIAAVLSIWTYGLSLVALWLVDLLLLKKLNLVAICYKCKTNFRNISNMNEIREFNHEMNDRIVYSDHDFKGKPLSH